MLILLCALIGFISSLLTSISGGGGFIVIPSLLLLGVPPLTAMGSHKVAGFTGGIASLLTYARSGVVQWSIAPVCAVCALAGGVVGVSMAMILPTNTLDTVLTFVLPVTMLFIMVFPKGQDNCTASFPPPYLKLRTALISLSVGIYDGFIGPGAGPCGLLAFHRLLHLSLLEASATSRLFSVTSSASALAMLIIHGKVNFSLAIPLALGTLVGSIIGSKLAVRCGARLIWPLLLCTFLLLAGSALLKIFLY